ncbi:MAG: acyl-CoA thioesterase [Candidatus Hydrogenedens sp.]|nr:acyl-CoA thioesterase [Candidatus Hydrogenedens sp.]
MFHFTVQPRFSETDGLGHINNTVLPVWFEEARTDLFRIFNPSLAMSSWNLILKRFDVEFVAQIWREYPVEIETVIEKIGTTSLTVVQRALQRSEPVAVGRTWLVYFDYQTHKPAPIPDDIREKLLPHLTE